MFNLSVEERRHLVETLYRQFAGIHSLPSGVVLDYHKDWWIQAGRYYRVASPAEVSMFKSFYFFERMLLPEEESRWFLIP